MLCCHDDLVIFTVDLNDGRIELHDDFTRHFEKAFYLNKAQEYTVTQRQSILACDKSIRVLFGMEGYAALDINPGPGYNTIPLRLIPGDPYIACPILDSYRPYQALTWLDCTAKLVL